jgi:quinoprotein glucose dehydrogenase
LRWSFHTIPHPGEYGYNTWPKDAWKYSGAANCWGGMALDEKRGIVYVPTGSASPDFYGASRIGNDLFADSLIALNAETGKRIWSFQGVRHDLWDRDFPAPPALVTVKRDGKEIPAAAQITKQGFVYVFNRVDGKPLFPIVYKKVQASTVPGEVSAKEQPFPLEPAPFARQRITANDLTNRTPEAHAKVLEEFRKARSGGQYFPLSVGKPTLIVPGTHGGADWGGPAVDPKTGVLYINSDAEVHLDTLVKVHEASGGRGTYQSQCSICHGTDRTGSPPSVPSLVNIGARLSDKQIAARIHEGGGRMPAFVSIQGSQLKELIAFLDGRDTGNDKNAKSGGPVSYQIAKYTVFEDPEGYPAVAPPWGTLNAIDLNTGKYLWKIPFGQYPKLVAKGKPDTGSPNIGGPIVTAGGLVFIGATDFDKKFRAYDKSTGKLLWETALPFPGNATPATYMVNGRQYVVIASGGGKLWNLAAGGVYVAFALPKK